jgi:hypothetical protein
MLRRLLMAAAVVAAVTFGSLGAASKAEAQCGGGYYAPYAAYYPGYYPGYVVAYPSVYPYRAYYGGYGYPRYHHHHHDNVVVAFGY